MKNDLLGTGTPVNKNDLKNYKKESRDNILEDLQENNDRSFTAAELWNIHKRVRTTVSMRRRIL